ncbi:hypothetical protein HPG69_016737 [Diceros bicornis minor]|uniref:Transmembrane protein 134 n=1 Tax=Diceros bicornis minor TaxID=77932 RepID=A0A7J7FM07_DICBM|nr:hypothetical protein HPG69_016737 [Diceros bicornis minor]
MSAARPQFSIDDAFELSLEDAGPVPESNGITRFGPLHFERRARFEVADEDKQSRLRYQNLENDEDGAQPSPEPDGGVSTRDSGQTSVRSSQWSFSTISNSTQRSYNACCSWTQHPLIQKNRRVVLASFLLLLLGLVLILIGVGLEVAPSPAEREACEGCDPLSPAPMSPCPDSAPPLLPQVSPAPSSSCLASCCWCREVRAGSGRGRGWGGPQAGLGRGRPRGRGLGADRPRPAVYHVVFIYCAVKGHRGFQFFYLPYFEK